MIYTLADSIDIPTCDVVTYAFSNDFSNDTIPYGHPIWVDPTTSATITYYEARTIVRQLIAGLDALALPHGSTLCLHAFNSIHYPLIYLAAIGAGMRFVGSNPAYKASEIKHLLRTAKVDVLLVDSGEVEKVLPVAVERGLSEDRIFVLGEGQKGLGSWTKLLSHGEKDWMTIDNEHASKRIPAVLLSTSGTTGLPKMAVMSHNGIITQAVMAEYVTGDEKRRMRSLLSLPMFHSFAIPYHILALRQGQTTYVMPRFDEEIFVHCIERYAITHVPTVPPVAMRVFDDSYRDRDLSSLRDVVCGGAPLIAGAQARLAARMGSRARLTQLWGMTELGWVTGFRNPERDESGSVGSLLPGVRAKVVDETGRELQEPGAKGEIWVHHRGMMMGYLDDAAATKSCTKDGWFKTGDVGYCIAERWFVVDRSKEMIKVRAWSVSPAEIEACILSHKDVEDAAVVGVPGTEDGGEMPIVFVISSVPAPRRQQLAEEVKAKVRKELASYKSLGEVIFVESIPRTAGGKILRRVLKEQYQDNFMKVRLDWCSGEAAHGEKPKQSSHIKVEEIPLVDLDEGSFVIQSV